MSEVDSDRARLCTLAQLVLKSEPGKPCKGVRPTLAGATELLIELEGEYRGAIARKDRVGVRLIRWAVARARELIETCEGDEVVVAHAHGVLFQTLMIVQQDRLKGEIETHRSAAVPKPQGAEAYPPVRRASCRGRRRSRSAPVRTRGSRRVTLAAAGQSSGDSDSGPSDGPHARRSAALLIAPTRSGVR
jgi:hypothetical protein